MEVACPKCSAHIALPQAQGPTSGKSGTITCSSCGHQFDARPTIVKPANLAAQPRDAAPATDTTLQQMTPEDAAAELGRRSQREDIKPDAPSPAAHDDTRDRTKPLAPPSSTGEGGKQPPAPPSPTKGEGKQRQGLSDDPKQAAAEKQLPEPVLPGEGKPGRYTPKSIGAYEVLTEISRGGMGVVYKAVDPQLRRLVAIKVLLAGEGAKDEDLKRFKREAQATARLQHPNIVPIYAVGEHEGKPYLVMDFVEGCTAKRLKEDGKITPRLALSIIEGVAEGLHHAHLHGVIHRDVKPANIIVDRSERAQLMDFGLARRVDEDLEATQSGTTMGTPSYMAPEQAEGRLAEVDPQSDVYSTGACLYELLTGRPPFEAPTVMATLRQVLEDPPVPPRRLNPKIHRDVETICLKCLEKNKRNRYSSALQLAEDIRRFNAGEAIIAKPLGVFSWWLRKARRHKEVTLALLLVIVSALGALGYSLRSSRLVAQQQIAERQRSLRLALDDGERLLNQAKFTVATLDDATRGTFQQNTAKARTQIADASAAFRQAEGIAPATAEAKRALEMLKKLDNELEVRRFIFKARAFLYPAQARPGDPPLLPNYAGAEFAAQEAVDRDPDNAEARELLRAAIGIRAVTVGTSGEAAEVFAKRIVDGAGRQLAADAGSGLPLGRTPVSGKELEPGLYLITFQRAGRPQQQATLAVTRDAREEDLHLKITLNVSDENMALIRAGNVTLPQLGVVSLPAFAIDRFEYPNKAGTVPLTGVSRLEALNFCKQQGKTLCTSAQWLRACMGDEEWRYPYGKAYQSNMCATGFDGEAQKRPLPSGLFARCRTPDGVYDMSGNVAEWTDSDQQETVFGGDWTSTAKFADLTVSCRARAMPEEVNKDRLGFRCCKAK